MVEVKIFGPLNTVFAAVQNPVNLWYKCHASSVEELHLSGEVQIIPVITKDRSVFTAFHLVLLLLPLDLVRLVSTVSDHGLVS